MIKIVYIPQIGLENKRFHFQWNGRVLTVSLRDENNLESDLKEDFDFSVLRPGDEVRRIETEILTHNPVISAKCDDNGDLEVQLIYWVQSFEEQIPENEIIEEGE